MDGWGEVEKRLNAPAHSSTTILYLSLPPSQTFTYNWFCRRPSVDPEHMTDKDGMVIPYAIQPIPPDKLNGTDEGGCFGEGPGLFMSSKTCIILFTSLVLSLILTFD